MSNACMVHALSGDTGTTQRHEGRDVAFTVVKRPKFLEEKTAEGFVLAPGKCTRDAKNARLKNAVFMRVSCGYEDIGREPESKIFQ